MDDRDQNPVDHFNARVVEAEIEGLPPRQVAYRGLEMLIDAIKASEAKIIGPDGREIIERSTLYQMLYVQRSRSHVAIRKIGKKNLYNVVVVGYEANTIILRPNLSRSEAISSAKECAAEEGLIYRGPSE